MFKYNVGFKTLHSRLYLEILCNGGTAAVKGVGVGLQLLCEGVALAHDVAKTAQVQAPQLPHAVALLQRHLQALLRSWVAQKTFSPSGFECTSVGPRCACGLCTA